MFITNIKEKLGHSRNKNFINLIKHKAGTLTAPDGIPLPVVPVGVGGGRPPGVPVRVLATPLLPSSLVYKIRDRVKQIMDTS